MNAKRTGLQVFLYVTGGVLLILAVCASAPDRRLEVVEGASGTNETPICTPSPTIPPRPRFEEYPTVIADLLKSDFPLLKDWHEAERTELTRILRDWGAITDDYGRIDVRRAGDEAFLFVHVIQPLDELRDGFNDRLLVYCQDSEGMQITFDSEDMSRFGYSIRLLPGRQNYRDINQNGLPEIAFSDRFCSASHCYEWLHVIESDGHTITDLIDGRLKMVAPTFSSYRGQITASSDQEAHTYSGHERPYTEIWQWNGSVYTRTHRIAGPPMVKSEIVEDADTALERGDFGRAVALYQSALDSDYARISNEGVPDGLDREKVDVALATYPRFKLIVGHAALGQLKEARQDLERLLAESPQDPVAQDYVELGRTFWDRFEATGDVHLACQAVVSAAATDARIAGRLFRGDGVTVYEPADLCRLPESSQ